MCLKGWWESNSIISPAGALMSGEHTWKIMSRCKIRRGPHRRLWVSREKKTMSSLLGKTAQSENKRPAGPEPPLHVNMQPTIQSSENLSKVQNKNNWPLPPAAKTDWHQNEEFNLFTEVFLNVKRAAVASAAALNRAETSQLRFWSFRHEEEDRRHLLNISTECWTPAQWRHSNLMEHYTD